MKLLLRPRTKGLIMPTDRETFGWNDSPDQEAFGRNGPPDLEVFGRNDPPDPEVFGWNGPRARKPSGGTVHGPGSLRTERSTGPGSLRAERSTGLGSLRTERSTGPGSLRAERSTDLEVFGWNGPRVRKPSGGTVHGPGSLWTEGFEERCQECSSEHVAWTPRPRTWRLSLCARPGHGIPPPRMATRKAKAQRNFNSMSVEIAPGPRFASGLDPASKHRRASIYRRRVLTSTKFCGPMANSFHI